MIKNLLKMHLVVGALTLVGCATICGNSDRDPLDFTEVRQVAWFCKISGFGDGDLYKLHLLALSVGGTARSMSFEGIDFSDLSRDGLIQTREGADAIMQRFPWVNVEQVCILGENNNNDEARIAAGMENMFSMLSWCAYPPLNIGTNWTVSSFGKHGKAVRVVQQMVGAQLVKVNTSISSGYEVNARILPVHGDTNVRLEGILVYISREGGTAGLTLDTVCPLGEWILLADSRSVQWLCEEP